MAEKAAVPYFISYARKDMALKDDFLGRLQKRLRLSRDYRFEPWQDEDILAGEDWAGEIDQALENCHFGLLLVSYEFLLSDFIDREELPRFIGPTAKKRAIPVGLERVPLDGSIDTKGLEQVQIYRDDRGRFFNECQSDLERDRFADGLFAQILRVMKKYF